MFQENLNLSEFAVRVLLAWMVPMAWQVAILVLVLYIVSRFVLPKTSARFRYALWLLVPIRLILPPTLAFATGWAWWILPTQPESEPIQIPTSREVSRSTQMTRDRAPLIEQGEYESIVQKTDFRSNREALLAVNGSEAEGNSGSSKAAQESIQMSSANVYQNYGAVWLIGIYLLCCVAMLVRLFLCHRAVAQMIRNSIAADSSIAQLTDECRRLLGLRHRVSVLVSSEAVSPMLVGVWRTAIVLPEGIAQLLTRDELRSVLVHELHHLQRHDSIIHFVQSLLHVFYWFHPAVWFAGRESRRMREMACDEGTVAALKGHRRAYGLGMVKIADMMTSIAPAVSLPILVSKSQMSARVFRILDPNLTVGKKLSLPAIVGLIGLALLLIPSAGQHGSRALSSLDASTESVDEYVPSNEAPDMSNASEQDKTALKKLRVKVVDEAGQAIQGVQVHSSSWTNDPAYKDKANIDLTTNEQGVAEVDVYPQLDILRIWASHPGRVTLFVHWEKGETDRIPESISLRLQKGTELGGIVVNAEGKPVANAKVEVSLSSGGEKLDTNANSNLDTWLANGEDAAITDEQGRWSIKNVPPGNDLDLSLVILHPEFLCESNWNSISKFGLTLDTLRDKSATIRLATGISITGRVVDADGKPVSDAMIVWGDRPYWENGSQETKTNAQGEFRIPQRKPGKIRLTVVAKNWMPQSLIVDALEGLEPVDFTLQPGRKLHLKVVDPIGKPILNAYVSLQKWRGVESLYNVKHPNVLTSGIPNRTDENGEFLWDWAPDDSISFEISVVENNEQIYQKSVDLIASDAIQTLTLLPKLSIAGTVVDRETNRPVTYFSLNALTYWSESESARGISQPSSHKIFSMSNFHFSYSSNDVKQLVFQFEAPGYRVYRTRRYGVNEPPQSLTIQLEPTPIQRGRVLNSNGDPVKDANVFLVKPDDSLNISNAKDYSSGMSPTTIHLDENGIFLHATQVSSYAIVVSTDEGYAEQYYGPGIAAGDLTIKPWARVEGILFQEGKPVADASIILSPIRQLGGDNPQVQDNFRTRTNAQGSFVFSKVPALPSTVGSLLSSWQDYPITSSQLLPLDLKPGETKIVNLGGDGLQIRGKVKVEGDGAEKIELRYGIHQLVRADGGAIAVPNHARQGLAYKAGEQRDFEQKLAGDSGNVLGVEKHTIKLNPDGTMLINGVRPGKYRFLLQVYEPPTGCLVDPVGYGYLEFDTANYAISNNTMDLGTIEIALKPAPKVGQSLPNFNWKDLTGKSHSLEEHRGKFVLIDFWATWCGPCVKSMPEMGRIHDSIAKSDRVQMVSLSIDSDIEAAKTVIREKKLNWSQGLIGDIISSPTGKALGIHTVPLYVLLDQQGIILLRTSSLEEVTKKMQDFAIE